VWAASEPEPSEPQVSVFDDTYTEGGFDLSAYKWKSNPSVISASYDDVTFSAIPEPATSFLLALGLAGLGVRRRRRSAH